jgi:hypothetical protein
MVEAAVNEARRAVVPSSSRGATPRVQDA